MSTFTSKSKQIFYIEWSNFLKIWNDANINNKSIEPYLFKINKIICTLGVSKNDTEFINKIKGLQLLKESQQIINDNKTYNICNVLNSNLSRQILLNEWNDFIKIWNDEDNDIEDISLKLRTVNTVINRLIMSENETIFIEKIQDLKLKTKIINSSKSNNIKSTTYNGELTVELIK